MKNDVWDVVPRPKGKSVVTSKDLGMMHYFLGMEVWQSANGIFLGQGKYAVEILKSFGMMDCKAMATPMASNLNLFRLMLRCIVS